MGGDSCKIDPAVAPPAFPGPANSTKLRRQQRKHTQISYRLMKAKLLSLVCPLPAPAIAAVDLEAFRESIYIVKADAASAEPEPHVLLTANMCPWCGTWQPLPVMSSDATEELGNNPTAAVVAEPCSDPDKDRIDVDTDSVLNYIHVTDAKQPADIIDMQLEAVVSAVDELLEACLGQALFEQNLEEDMPSISQAADRRA